MWAEHGVIMSYVVKKHIHHASTSELESIFRLVRDLISVSLRISS